jgi:valyl-tRNA synthetase
MAADRHKVLASRTRYEPADVESRVFARWQDARIFHPEPAGGPEENYSIAVPPPNVTGSLHMGHALNGSIQDVLIRLARMRGLRTKWIYGTDHAGIATQRQVEKALAEQDLTKEAVGREAFVERVWQWRRVHGSTITEQYKRLGASLDYDDERFTMDDEYQRAVALVFVRLYEKDLIYRDNYMVNWDPGLRTAISDLEVEQRSVEDTLYSIDYPLESGSGSITVATVRPETMLADTAIAVNPSDERYSRLIGETAMLPLVGRRLPVIADDHVDPEFGTGALKITPGHDPADFEIGRRNGLEEVTVIGEDGRITDAAPGRYRGMETDEARAAVVADLREEGLISATEAYVHDVPHSHRSGRRIEPLISLQWFCDMNELARPAIEALRDGRTRFHPERPHAKVYLEWLENIRPWCISRQLWWGHQLPVWYRGGETYVGVEPPAGEAWERDPDVLDTWFSSGLWPFATLGWPEETPEYRAFYPTDLNSTARDIIFLWVARMVMFGLELTGEVPFSDVNIHSVIQAPDGRRMSKSLGTGIDPLDLIEEHGADALRFGLLAMSSAQDVRFNEERVKQGRDLANKLWNASRLILMRVSEVEPDPRAAIAVEDRWIVSRLEHLTARVSELLDGFRFSHAALDLYGAFWSELCDWYLELAKPRLYEEDNEAVSAVALWALERTLRLLHPVMPFVTEEIWSLMPEARGSAARAGDSIRGERGLLAVAGWPKADESLIDDAAEAEIGRLIDAVTALRRYREEVAAKPAAVVRGRLAADGYEGLAGHLARLARFEFVAEDPSNGDVLATVPVPGGGVQVLPSDAFDPGEAERRRAARREQLVAEIERAERKLANDKFVERAPAEVVAEERRKLEEYREALRRLEPE